jgi:hypothetical protein
MRQRFNPNMGTGVFMKKIFFAFIPLIVLVMLFVNGIQTAAQETGPAGGTITYKIGDRGPAGGIIFFDKWSNEGGWRYLEAAPAETEQILPWGDGFRVNGTRTTIGAGRQNTEIISTYLNNQGAFGYAAQYCMLLEYGGYDDWFLPSKDELNLMFMNMKQKGLGNFHGDWYWSSSQDSNLPWVQTFTYQEGKQWNSSYYYANDIWVRAIRAF